MLPLGGAVYKLDKCCQVKNFKFLTFSFSTRETLNDFVAQLTTESGTAMEFNEQSENSVSSKCGINIYNEKQRRNKCQNISGAEPFFLFVSVQQMIG